MTYKQITVTYTLTEKQANSLERRLKEMKTCENCKHLDTCQLNQSFMRRGAICTVWENIPDTPITWALGSLDAAAALLESWKEGQK